MFKNNKGQVTSTGLIMIFITVIVGLILLVAAAGQIGHSTSLATEANFSQTVVAGTAVSIPGKAWSGLVVYNVSGDLVDSANYTLANNQVVNGAETATLTAASDSAVYGTSWNLSGTYEPTTYISSSGARSIAGLIIVFFAIAIAVITLIPTLRNKLLDRI